METDKTTSLSVFFYFCQGDVFMGKASRTKRDRRNQPANEITRTLPVVPAAAAEGLAEWDGPTGYATGAGVVLLRERSVPEAVIAAYATTGNLLTATSVNSARVEELLHWGSAAHEWEIAHWDDFIVSRPELKEQLTSNPAVTLTNPALIALVDAAWALSVGWATNAAAGIVATVAKDADDELNDVMSTAALTIATLKNQGMFTNAVTQQCVRLGAEFNVADTVRSYLGAANFEPAVIRMHDTNSAAAMLVVHTAIIGGALAAGVLTMEQLEGAAGSTATPND
jgi:hypothetical protein